MSDWEERVDKLVLLNEHCVVSHVVCKLASSLRHWSALKTGGKSLLIASTRGVGKRRASNKVESVSHDRRTEYRDTYVGEETVYMGLTSSLVVQ